MKKRVLEGRKDAAKFLEWNVMVKWWNTANNESGRTITALNPPFVGAGKTISNPGKPPSRVLYWMAKQYLSEDFCIPLPRLISEYAELEASSMVFCGLCGQLKDARNILPTAQNTVSKRWDYICAFCETSDLDRYRRNQVKL